MTHRARWLAVLLVLSGLAWVVPSKADQVELVVTNPGFEEGFTGWRVPWDPYNNAPTIDTTFAHSGTSSLRMTKRWGGDRVEQDIVCNAPAGTLIRIRFWFRMPDPGSFGGKWFVAWVYPTGERDSPDVTMVNMFQPNTQWAERSIVYLTQRPIQSITLEFSTQWGDGGYAGPVLVDDISATAQPQLAQTTTELLISSWWTSQVLRYDAATGELRGVAGSHLTYPVGLAIGADRLLYACHGCWSYRGWWDGVPPAVKRFDWENGQYVGEFVTGYSGGLNRPNWLAFGPNGDLFVSSIFTHSILRYDGQTGASVGTFVPAGYGGMQDPRMLLFRDGMLYVATTVGVLRYNASDGSFVDCFIPQGAGGRSLYAGNLVVGPSGDLFMTDGNTLQILRFDGATGAFKGVFVQESCSDTYGLTFGPDGNLYVPSIQDNCVRRYDGTTGLYIDTFLPEGSGFETPTGALFVPPADGAAPVTVAAPQPPANEAGWNNTPVTVALTATDEGSGVAATYYTLDGGDRQTYTAPVVISSDGVHTLTFWSTDNAGNEEAPNSLTVKIDTAPPAITVSSPTEGMSYPLGSVLTVSYAAADDGSQVSVVSGVLNGVPVASGMSVPLSALGAATLVVTAIDNAGNQRTETVSFTVDQYLDALESAGLWIGLKNSDDVGTSFDLRGEVYVNSVLVGAGELYEVYGGSSGFNNAHLRSIPIALDAASLAPSECAITFKVYARISAGSDHRSGTARLWFNDAQANSRFDATIGGSAVPFYLVAPAQLSTSIGPGPRKYVDVFADRAKNGNPFKLLGQFEGVVP